MTKRRFGLILGRMLLARRGLLVGGMTLALTAVGTRLVGAAAKPTVTVHKSPT